MKLTKDDFEMFVLGNEPCVGCFEHSLEKKGIDVYKLINQILKNQEKAEKWDNLMTHTKFHNAFGCQYHFDLKEERRRNQFLQSENVKNKKTVERLKKLDIVTKIRFAYSMCNRDHPETRETLEKLGDELQKILEGKE